MNNTFRVARIAVSAALVSAALTNHAFGAAITGVNLTNTITASMDGGLSKSGDTWYELGVNAAAPTTGIRTGLIQGQVDPLSTYIIPSATGLNTLMLDTNRRSGTLTFDRPISATALSLAASSGHGAGTLTPTLRFTDGTTDTISPIVVGDWFDNTNRIDTANGRMSVTGNTFDNVNSDNPRILANNESLSATDAGKAIFAIDFKWSGAADNTVTAIFGVSGDVTGIGHYTAIPVDPGSFTQDMIVGLAEVPEPGTMALFGLGTLSLLGYAWRKRS
jgi:PEP-CTERM motif